MQDQDTVPRAQPSGLADWRSVALLTAFAIMLHVVVAIALYEYVLHEPSSGRNVDWSLRVTVGLYSVIVGPLLGIVRSILALIVCFSRLLWSPHASRRRAFIRTGVFAATTLCVGFAPLIYVYVQSKVAGEAIWPKRIAAERDA